MAEGKLDKGQQLFFENSKPEEQLFDLENDPHELYNLADQAEYKEILLNLRTQLIKEEKDMTAQANSFQPVKPKSVDILKWIKYTQPRAYQDMLNGKEIGFKKYTELYKKYNQAQ